MTKMTITLKDLNKIIRFAVDIFDEEDQDYVDRRRITRRERAIDEILSKVTDDPEMQRKIYSAITKAMWSDEEWAASNALAKLGVEVKRQ